MEVVGRIALSAYREPAPAQGDWLDEIEKKWFAPDIAGYAGGTIKKRLDRLDGSRLTIYNDSPTNFSEMAEDLQKAVTEIRRLRDLDRLAKPPAGPEGPVEFPCEDCGEIVRLYVTEMGRRLCFCTKCFNARVG